MKLFKNNHTLKINESNQKPREKKKAFFFVTKTSKFRQKVPFDEILQKFRDLGKVWQKKKRKLKVFFFIVFDCPLKNMGHYTKK